MATAMTINSDLIRLLNEEAEHFNRPEFVAADPIQFPRRFSRLQDIEIAGLLSATIAWGNRKMICSNCEKMLSLMDYQPYNYVMNEGYEDLGERFNIHRTFFSTDFAYMLRGLRLIYKKYASLDDFCNKSNVPQEALSPWHFAEHLGRAFAEANDELTNSRCLPVNLQSTALKRINMLLRWLVRDDGIVDLGVWRSLKPSQLFIPLDVHVINTATALGLLSRKQADRKAAVSLTDTLRPLRPEDPAVYDFALFGIGIMTKK